MKLCRYCKKSYSEKDFGVALTTENKVYRRHKCRFCYRKTKKNLIEKRRKWIDDYKRSKWCSHCGVSDYRVIDFHHQDGEKKEFSIAVAHAEGYSLERIKKEIEKCILLCANCHRIVHYNKSK